MPPMPELVPLTTRPTALSSPALRASSRLVRINGRAVYGQQCGRGAAGTGDVADGYQLRQGRCTAVVTEDAVAQGQSRTGQRHKTGVLAAHRSDAMATAAPATPAAG